jgi:hypothetical protein
MKTGTNGKGDKNTRVKNWDAYRATCDRIARRKARKVKQGNDGLPFLDLDSDANAALVRYPCGYAEFQGSRFGRERYARMFLEMIIKDRLENK